MGRLSEVFNNGGLWKTYGNGKAPALYGTNKSGFRSQTDRNQKMRIFLEWVLISILTAYLCYDALFAAPLFLPGAVLWSRYRTPQFLAKRKRQYADEFAEGMEAIASALSVGFSLERAIGEACRSLRMIHTRDNAMMQELRMMDAQIAMNRDVETLLAELALRSGIDDAQSLAEVCAMAKRNGGNLPRIMNHTIMVMGEKESVTREIEVVIAGKRYEQMVMSIIPFAMIAYLRVGSPGYLDSLYHSIAGALVMSICLCIYAGALYMGNRVIQIDI